MYLCVCYAKFALRSPQSSIARYLFVGRAPACGLPLLMTVPERCPEPKDASQVRLSSLHSSHTSVHYMSNMSDPVESAENGETSPLASTSAAAAAPAPMDGTVVTASKPRARLGPTEVVNLPASDSEDDDDEYVRVEGDGEEKDPDFLSGHPEDTEVGPTMPLVQSWRTSADALAGAAPSAPPAEERPAGTDQPPAIRQAPQALMSAAERAQLAFTAQGFRGARGAGGAGLL